MLTRRTQKGNRSSTHATTSTTSSRITAHTYPRNASQRGMMPSWSAIVAVEIVNTAAMRMAYVVTSVCVTVRANSHASDDIKLDEAVAAPAMSPPASAADTKSMATNSSPLPRNIDAKNLSSCWPIRSRKTPMNHKNAMPANGTRLSAITTARSVTGSTIQAVISWGRPGRARRIMTMLILSNREKAIPAVAAARGVLSADLDSGVSGTIALLPGTYSPAPDCSVGVSSVITLARCRYPMASVHAGRERAYAIGPAFNMLPQRFSDTGHTRRGLSYCQRIPSPQPCAFAWGATVRSVSYSPCGEVSASSIVQVHHRCET